MCHGLYFDQAADSSIYMPIKPKVNIDNSKIFLSDIFVLLAPGMTQEFIIAIMISWHLLAIYHPTQEMKHQSLALTLHLS